MWNRVVMGGAALALLASSAFLATPSLAEEKKADAAGELEAYAPVAGVSGKIVSVGSDTLNNLMQYWMEGFKKQYPNVQTEMEGKGSSTAPGALIEGRSHLGPMSRPMKAEEIKQFEDKFGYKPSYVAVSIDALAVFVHKDNPVEKLTLPQVDAIFSSTRKGKYEADVTKWGQTGLKGEWENLGITLYGRNSASGTYGFFKEHALYKGDYKATVKEQPGSSTVVQLIAEDRSGCGYSGIGYLTAGVRTVPLANDAKGEAYEANAENCYSGKYPLSRFLYVYFNRKPGTEVPLQVREFLRFTHSKEGQDIVVKEGFVPMRKKEVEKFAPAYK
ncbi:MAG: phosphate ABC transporter substrate-binding protein [Planctomycetes bacterium]|nr:phosphate ABC transporter substrate-binding protein [Planctomycetota bacterium]